MIGNNEHSILGENIRTLMNENNLTLEKLASAIKYNRRGLSAASLGKQNLQLNTLVKIAEYFDLSLYILCDRNFKNPQYRKAFHYVGNVNYIDLIRTNFRNSKTKQSMVALDSTTVSHIMNGRRNNITINTIVKFAEAAGVNLSELFITDQDRKIKKQLIKEEL